MLNEKPASQQVDVTPTMCYKLRFCVCQERGLLAFLFHKKLREAIKPYLQVVSSKKKDKGQGKGEQARGSTHGEAQTKSKPKPQKPALRVKMEAAMLVLKLQQATDTAAVAADVSAGHQLQTQHFAPRSRSSTEHDWSSAKRRRCHDGSARSDSEIYFHIGYMNYSTWLFSGLPVSINARLPDGGQVLNIPSQPIFTGCLPFLQDNVNFLEAWKVSFHELRSTAEKLTPEEMTPALMTIDRCEAMPEMQFWRGSAVEQNPPKPRSQRKGQQGSRKGSGKDNGKGKGKRRAKQQELVPAGPRHAQIQVPAAIADVYSDEEALAEDLEAILSDSEAVEHDEEEPDNESENAGDDDEAQPDADTAGAAARAVLAKRGRVGRAQRPAQAAAEPGDAAAAAAAGRDDHDSSAAAGDAARGNTGERHRAGQVRTHTERKVVVPGLGSIHYYPQTKAFSAFCMCSSHQPDCRRSRKSTKKDQRPGQGRPLGFLMGWLMKASRCSDRFQHVKFCTPTLQERQEGRRRLLEVEGSEVLFQREREKLAGEPDEPPSIP